MARKSRKNIAEAVPVHNDLFINAALYIRLSVEDGKKRSNSIENQQLIIDDYISDKPEFKVFNTYIDNGLTGATFNTMFSYYDGLQEEYHNKLHELLRKEVKNHG